MIYDLISKVYDKVNGYIDYQKWADFIEKSVRAYTDAEHFLGLDLGCGTGRMTIELAKRGFDMTGVDYSADMLAVAAENERVAGLSEKVLWLCQDITEFELYGTVDFCISCLDTLNHLTTPADFKRCLDLVYNYLSPGGIFIFDINCKAKFENTYAERAYVIEEGKDLIIWQNNYRKSSGLCDFYITLLRESDGLYERYDEVQSERMYTLRSVKAMLKKSGFEFIGAYSDFCGAAADDTCERAYIIAKSQKNG